MLCNICDPLLQNEHKVDKLTIWDKGRSKFFEMQASKWYMTCGYWCLSWPSTTKFFCKISFVFYCFMSLNISYISVCILATLRSFCDSKSHISCDRHALSKRAWTGFNESPFPSSTWKVVTIWVLNFELRRQKRKSCFRAWPTQIFWFPNFFLTQTTKL